MRSDYIVYAVVLFILAVVFYAIWFNADPTNITLVIAIILFFAAISYFITGLVRSRPSRPVTGYVPPTLQPTYQPAPTYQPQPTYQPVSPPKSVPPISTPVCPSCGRPLTYLADINKWYCENERKIMIPISSTTSPFSGQTNVSQQLAAERAKLRIDLQMLDERLVEGKISEATYKGLKEKYEARLKEIE